jgi:hypothetical protein
MSMQELFYSPWRKSSHSGSAGQECVEVTAAWRTSSYSGSGNSECVEVAPLVDRLVAMRDSKDPDGPMLSIAPGAWTSLLSDIKGGAHDLATSH